MEYKFSDPKLSSPEYSGERNDCTVRALANVAQLPYGAALRYTELAGRKPKRGLSVSQIMDMWKDGKLANYKVTAINTYDPIAGRYGARDRYPTLEQVRRRYPKGRYYVVVRGHAMAMIDGVIHDNAKISGPKSRVKHLFHFEPL